MGRSTRVVVAVSKLVDGTSALATVVVDAAVVVVVRFPVRAVLMVTVLELPVTVTVREESS